MFRKSYFTIIFSMLLVMALPGASAAARMTVFVSIPPQKYFVQQIGGDMVDVHVMVEPGADPHTYEPKPRQMVAVSKAKLYFAIGIEFEEARLEKIAAANPKMRVVHTDHGIMKIPMAAHHHEEHDEHEKEESHHESDEHDEHGGLDPHIWLSPPLVMIQARMVLSALQDVDPANRDAYSANYRKFIGQVVDLDLKLSGMFAGKRGLKFMVFHPAWGVFAHTYGLIQVPVEIEGKSPKPAQLKELIEHAREDNVRVIFVQPQFSTQSAELVAREIGGEVVFADPLAADWMGNLVEVAGKFKDALR